MVSPINSGAISATLAQVQTARATQTTSLGRLSTGRSVNSAVDNAQAYVLAQGLLGRADSLSQVGSDIGQGIGALQAAGNGLTTIGSLIDLMKGLARGAQGSSDPAQVAAFQAQYNSVAQQIDQAAADASYNGLNLIQSSPGSLSIAGAPGGGTIVSGRATDSASLGITAAANWATTPATIQATLSTLDQAAQTVRSTASTLGTANTNLQIQAQYVQAQATTTARGAAGLTGADQTAQATYAVAAATYSALGQAALRAGVQSERAVLGITGSGSGR
jgi:flagellin-like hook-associated protein FlgL